MPELPEAETIVRSLRPKLEGRRIEYADFRSRRVSPHSARLLIGRGIESVRRHGKHILLVFEHGCARIKLGMTGSLLINQAPGPYTRAVVGFDDGTHLCFDDIRQFGSIELLDGEPTGLGPDPFELSSEEFAKRLKKRKTEAKRLLLDQGFVRGVGNIYADEALFRAGIHPKARTQRLTLDRAGILHAELLAVLSLAIENRGSSVSDYVDASGQQGGFQHLHRVYRRQGQPCPFCGTPIRRIVVAQRGTHFCPRCQRR